jgi:hypothetical protein
VTARRRLTNSAGLFVVAVLMLGTLGVGVGAPADARSEQDCEIPKDKPLKIMVREDRQVKVDCVDGKHQGDGRAAQSHKGEAQHWPGAGGR